MLFGGASGAFLAVLLSYMATPEHALLSIAFIGALLGAVTGWLGGSDIRYPGRDGVPGCCGGRDDRRWIAPR